MRRGLIGLIVLFSISLTPAYSSTPPKAGSVCPKQGVTKIYKDRKFTCIKSGKRLIWNKGRAVKDNVSTKASQIPEWQLVVEALNKKNAVKGESRVVSKVSAAARSITSRTQQLIDIASEASTYFQQFAFLDRDIHFWILGTKDISFVESLISQKPNLIKEYYRELYGGSAELGGSGLGGVDPEGQPYLIIVLADDYIPERSFNSRHMIYHEMVHVFQYLFSGTPRGNSWPCWYGEGVAQLFSWANDGVDLETSMNIYKSIRSDIVNDFASGGGEFVRRQMEIQFTYPSDSNDLCKNWGRTSYTLGHLVSEKFVIDFGLNSLINFANSLHQSDYRVAFKTITGIDESEWFKKSVIPYVVNIGSGKESTVSSVDLEKRRSFIYFSQPKVVPENRDFAFWQDITGKLRIGSWIQDGSNSSTQETSSPSSPDELNGRTCQVLGEIIKNSVGEFHCQTQGETMRWAKNNPAPDSP